MRPVRRSRIACMFARPSSGSCPGAMLAWYWKTFGRRQRAEAEQAFLVPPHVPGGPVEAVDLDVGDDHPHRLAGLAGKGDPGLLADDAVAAVAAGQPARGDRLGLAVLDDHRRHAVVRLLEAAERGAELDRAAELRQPQPQGFFDPPLGRDQARRIRDVGPVAQRLGRGAAQRSPGRRARSTGSASPSGRGRAPDRRRRDRRTPRGCAAGGPCPASRAAGRERPRPGGRGRSGGRARRPASARSGRRRRSAPWWSSGS